MNMSPVNSSNIDAVGYDPARKVLIVTFKNNSTYEYDGVPADLYSGLLAATSVGQYLAQNIKGKYAHRKVG